MISAEFDSYMNNTGFPLFLALEATGFLVLLFALIAWVIAPDHRTWRDITACGWSIIAGGLVFLLGALVLRSWMAVAGA